MSASPEQLAYICDELATGKSLRAVCREMGLAESSVRRWLSKDADAMAQYARACELRADSLFDQVMEIADDKTMTPEDRRIAIDARKWASGKLSGKYSDKLTVKNDTTVTVKHDLDNLSTSELEQLETILAKSELREGSTGEAVAASLH